MRQRCWQVAAVTVLLAASAHAQLVIEPPPLADFPPDKQTSAVQEKEAVSYAGGVMRVVCEPSSGFQDEDLVKGILSGLSHGVIKSVSKDAGVPTDNAGMQVSDIAKIEIGSLVRPEGSPVRFLVSAESYDERVSAEKLLTALATEFQRKLREVDPHGAFVEQLHSEKAQLQKMAADLANKHEMLWNLAAVHKVELDPAIATQRRLRVEGEFQATQVELQGLEARRRVIEHQIAELAKKVEQAAGVDPAVMSELKKSVDARHKILQYQQSRLASGFAGVSAEDVEKAKDELAQAEAELARYRASAVEAAGGLRIAALRQRLDDTAIEIAETSARRDLLEKLSEEFSRHSSQVELKQIELKLYEQDYRHSREELARREAEARAYLPPVVTLIQD